LFTHTRHELGTEVAQEQAVLGDASLAALVDEACPLLVNTLVGALCLYRVEVALDVCVVVVLVLLDGLDLVVEGGTHGRRLVIGILLVLVGECKRPTDRIRCFGYVQGSESY